MAWRRITDDDIATILSSQELAEYQSRPLDAGEPDPLPGLISSTVTEARGAVAANPRNRLASDEQAVPESLIPYILAIIRYRLLARLPVPISDARKDEYREAVRVLRDISLGKRLVERPDSSAPARNASTVIAARDRQVTGERLKGL